MHVCDNDLPNNNIQLLLQVGEISRISIYLSMYPLEYVIYLSEYLVSSQKWAMLPLYR